MQQRTGNHCSRESGDGIDALASIPAAVGLDELDLPATVWVTDRDFDVISVLGSGTDDETVQNLSSLKNNRLAMECHRKSLEGESGIYDHRIGDHTFEVRVSPRTDGSGSIIGCTALAIDITERRRRDRKLMQRIDDLEAEVAEREAELAASYEQLAMSERMAALGTLAGGLGHDIGNILLPMRLRLDSVQRLDLPKKAHEDLQAFGRSLEYLRQLCNSLRQLVIDPDENDPHAVHDAVSLPEWWDRVGALLRTALPKQAKLTTHFADDLPCVDMPQHLLTQSVLNLVMNAGDAIEGEGEVVIAAEPAADGQSVRLCVCDNGPGMTADVQRRVMQPFFTTKTRRFSTGLGLYVVQGIIRSVGGSLRIDSEPGKGTTVTLTIPTAADDEESAAATESAMSAVIAVADNRMAAFAGALLSTSGFDVRYNGDLKSCDTGLYITDAADLTPSAAQSLLEAQGLRQLIVFDEETDPWHQIGATALHPSSGMEALRSALRKAASALRAARRKEREPSASSPSTITNS